MPLRGRDREPERFGGLREAAGHRQRERSRDAKEEFVAISEIEQATAVLIRMARDWLSEKT